MKPRAAAPAARRGVSLIGLLMTLSLLVIVASVTLPALGRAVAGDQVVDADDEAGTLRGEGHRTHILSPAPQ